MGEAKGEVYSGKTMEKVSYTWLLQDYKKYRELGPGVALVSPAFDGPNGHKFKIKFYPGGATQRAYIAWAVSFAIETTQTAELVLSFKTVDPLISFASAQSCSFKKRGIFRRVFSVQAGHTSPSIQLSRYRLESELITGENAFKIEATIGVFINTNTNTNHPPIDRFLFFKVDDKRFFAEQSIIEERCPALLPNSSSHEPDADIVVTDIEPDIFDALLWFIYNKKHHHSDAEDICRSNTRDPNSYRTRIWRVAMRCELPGFVTSDSGVYLEDLQRPFVTTWNTVCQIIEVIRSKLNRVPKIVPDS